MQSLLKSYSTHSIVFGLALLSLLFRYDDVGRKRSRIWQHPFHYPSGMAGRRRLADRCGKRCRQEGSGDRQGCR